MMKRYKNDIGIDLHHDTSTLALFTRQGEYRSIVKNLIDNFGREFERVPIEERKVLVKKVISEIIVDRDRNLVRFYVRRIPAVLPMIDELMKKERELTKPVSSPCSGGPNIPQLTTFIREFIYVLS